MKFVSFSLKNSLLLNLLTIFVLSVGTIVMLNMPREAFPAVDFGNVSIVTVYPGASPKEVEMYVTNRLEEEIESITRIDNYISSSRQGLSFIFIQLDPTLSRFETKITINEIQRAIDRIRDLPAEVIEAPLVKEIDSTALPLMEIGITGAMEYDKLHAHADRILDILKWIPEAAHPSTLGFYDKEFWVEIDPKKLQHHHIGLGEIVLALGAKNINLPGGVLKSKAGDYIVRTIGEVASAEAIDEVVLRSSLSGRVLRVKDVGRTRATYEESDRIFRTNGKASINISVTKKRGGDILDLVDKIKEELSQYQEKFGGGALEISYVNDLSRYVRNRLGVLYNNGIVGILLVLVSLLIFLSRGIAFVTALGMPVALLGAVLVMNWMGMTINLLTMFGLVIVLGMLVDDAIIVGENIWQHYENGKSPWEATIAGTAEVFWPVTATILTTIAAFSPLLMMSGIMGKFISSLPKVIIVCLIISLTEAMLILPTHAYDMLRINQWLRRKRSEFQAIGTQKTASKFMAKLIDHYEKMLGVILRLRYLFLAACFALLGYTIHFAATKMKVILFPEEGMEAFFIRGTMPVGTAKELTAAKMEAFERLVAKLPATELKDYITYVGRHQNDSGDPLGSSGSHLGQVGVYLTPEFGRERTAQDIIEAMRPKAEELAAELGFEKFSFVKLKGGPPVGKPVAIRIYGDDFATVKAIVPQVFAELEKLDGVSDIDVTPLEGKSELLIAVDDMRASKRLSSTRDIALHVRATIEGQIASHVNQSDERIPIRVRYNKAAREDLEALKGTALINRSGQMVPLAKVATISEQTGRATIKHRNGRRIVTVTAAVDERVISSSEVNEYFAPIARRIESRHPGITIEAGGEYEDTTESMESLKQAFFIALCLIFLILAAQFKSMTQPIVVMMAIPFGIIGVIYSFYLHGLPLSFLGLIGVIGLTGVVVNDSIVLVDFVNKARERGLGVHSAVIYAARRRFRAVVLTSITTVAGLLPLAYGIGGYDMFLRPAAMALGYGLLFASLLILSLVPALYVVRIDIANALLYLAAPIARAFGGKLEPINTED